MLAISVKVVFKLLATLFFTSIHSEVLLFEQTLDVATKTSLMIGLTNFSYLFLEEFKDIFLNTYKDVCTVNLSSSLKNINKYAILLIYY